MKESQAIAAAFRFLDQHKRNLRSQNKRVRARAQVFERKLRKLVREIDETLSGGRR